MLEVLILATGLIIGLVIGRWWVVVIAAPVGVWFAYHAPIENSDPPYWDVAVVATLILGAAIGAGVILRRSGRPRV
jgi:hypothetical protein